MEKQKREFVVCEYMTIDELAKRWRKNKFTIYHIKDKHPDFPRQYKFFGKNILFKIAEVIDFEEKYPNITKNNKENTKNAK